MLTNIIILVMNFKDLILNSFESSKEVVKIVPYDSEITRKGLTWLRKLKKSVPESDVFFVGSAALKIAGGRDLDYVICTNDEKLNKYVQRISKLFGKPIRNKKDVVEWNMKSRGVNVDVIMLPKDSRIFRMLVGTHQAIANNKKILKEYVALKKLLNGKSKRQYELKRAFFFNKVYYQYGPGLKNIYKMMGY